MFVEIASVPAVTMGSCRPLASVLETLAAERIIVVLCSRRTRAEVEAVRQALGLYHPFVCEGGAVVFVPDKYFGSGIENTRTVGGYQAIELGAPYEQVVETLRRVADRLNLQIEGFHDMSVEQVARECGVSLLAARRAKLREYGERFRLLSANPVAEGRLVKALETAGLICRPDGQFFDVGTVSGPARALATLTTLYRVALGPVLALELDGGVRAEDLLRRVAHEIESIRDARLPSPAARQTR